MRKQIATPQFPPELHIEITFVQTRSATTLLVCFPLRAMQMKTRICSLVRFGGDGRPNQMFPEKIVPKGSFRIISIGVAIAPKSKSTSLCWSLENTLNGQMKQVLSSCLEGLMEKLLF